jgi:hypothetical protein
LAVLVPQMEDLNLSVLQGQLLIAVVAAVAAEMAVPHPMRSVQQVVQELSLFDM